ncbi:MAG TPA: hypothetical protein VNC81_03325 [Xanthobacteraceae bacterium]|jgi:hypothetical protein|nr:hypothetical protein [Xanthobacteraceae bacterium]
MAGGVFRPEKTNFLRMNQQFLVPEGLHQERQRPAPLLQTCFARLATAYAKDNRPTLANGAISTHLPLKSASMSLKLGRVPTWVRQVLDKSHPDPITDGDKQNWNS